MNVGQLKGAEPRALHILDKWLETTTVVCEIAELEQFTRLVAEEERVACAKVCQEVINSGEYDGHQQYAAAACRNEITLRSNGSGNGPAVTTEEKKMQREQVYEAINSERYYQNRKWGSVQDHPHEVGGWLTLMRKLLRDAEDAWASSDGDYKALLELRKVMAVGVACAEQHGLPARSLTQPGTE